MTRIKFKQYELRTNHEYLGTINNFKVDRQKGYIYVFVSLSKYPREVFMRSWQYSESLESDFAVFCQNCGVLEKDGGVYLEDLLGAEVKVTLKKSYNEKWYIDEIVPDYEIAEDSNEEYGVESEYYDDTDELEFDEE